MQVQTIKDPKELMLKLEKIIDPSGIGSMYELYRWSNEMLYNSKHNLTLKFANHFNKPAEQIQQHKMLDLEEEKRNYLFAVERHVPAILQCEKNQHQIN